MTSKVKRPPDSRGAEAAGEIHAAIVRLHENLIPIIEAKIDLFGQKLDFSQCLRKIIDNVELFFPDAKDKSRIIGKLKRARNIRNRYSHQDFDIRSFAGDTECLAKVAELMGLKHEANRIMSLISTTNEKGESWKQLKEEGSVHYKNRRWTEAMNCYTKAIHINPKVAVLYSNRALCELQLSKFQLARDDAEDAIELDPKQVKYYRTLSSALAEMSLYKEAMDVCKAGLEIDPRDEILLIRQRDCSAYETDRKIKEHPVYGGEYHVKNYLSGGLESFMKSPNEVSPDEVQQGTMQTISNSQKLANAHQILLSVPCSVQEELKALKIFETAARKGSAEGLYNVGRMYKDGLAGLPRDFLKANELFFEAASQKPYMNYSGVVLPNVGVAEAELSIGNAFQDGVGVDKDEVQAFKWFLKSANHGCPSAQNRLGLALWNGAGCKVSLESARHWFQKSAELGQSEAQLNLADMLIEGKGGPVDREKAAELLKLAADQGLPGALFKLQDLLKAGIESTKLTNELKKSVEERAEQCDMESVFLMGFNFLQGTGGVSKDLHKAETYLRRAATLGHPKVDIILGELLIEMRKSEEAFKFIRKAAETTSDPDAQWLLGRLYAFGHGCERDEKKAERWLKRSKKNDGISEIIKQGGLVTNFEKELNLVPSGLTLGERANRYLSSFVKDPEAREELEKVIQFYKHKEKNPPRPVTETAIMAEKFPQMLECAKTSKTAERFLRANFLLGSALECLKGGSDSEAFQLFNKSRQVWDLLPIDICTWEVFNKAARKCYEANRKNGDALFVILRYQAVHHYDVNNQLSLAKECVSIDPRNADFHHMAGCLYGFSGQFEISLRCIDRALELNRNPDWLYDKASSLRLSNADPNEVIAAYEEYISESENDARKIPEAYYCLGVIYAQLSNMNMAKRYLQKAQKAELPPLRLPCFGPVKDDFPPKYLLQTVLQLEKMGLKASHKVDQPHSSCKFCGKSGVVLTCSKCKQVKYCNRECQKKDWKDHKKTCC